MPESEKDEQGPEVDTEAQGLSWRGRAAEAPAEPGVRREADDEEKDEEDTSAEGFKWT